MSICVCVCMYVCMYVCVCAFVTLVGRSRVTIVSRKAKKKQQYATTDSYLHVTPLKNLQML